MTDIINNLKSFKSNMKSSSIRQFKTSMDLYSASFDDALTLKKDIPIILDTNILLRYYSISFNAREKLFKFISENISRIYLSEQIQFEFLKNREDVIGKFFEQVTTKIPKDFTLDILNKIKSFNDQHKTVLKDYPYVEPELKNNLELLGKTLEKLNIDVEGKKNQHKTLLIKDPFVELLNSCKIAPSLSETEISFLKLEFDSLSKNFSESDLEKGRNVFPGSGDIKQKPNDPYGDYLIYHEMIKLMNILKTNAIFLTFDNSKGDWMKKDKLPHLSYIENAYKCSEKILYVLDAERTLEDILNVNIDSLIGNDKEEITIENLQNLLNTGAVFSGLEPYVIINKHIVKELKMNGYISILQLTRDCEKVRSKVQAYLANEDHTLNRMGVLRACLRILKPSYPYLTTDGTLKVTKKETDDVFAKYRYLA